MPFVDRSFRTDDLLPLEVLLGSHEDAAEKVLHELSLGFDAV
jgi:hypothetical protein